MKHKRISRKLLSALLAFAMLLAFAAEGAGYVYASELQENATPVAEQLQEADETGESAQEADTQEESEVPEPQETAEQAEPAEQSEEATAEEKVPAPEEAEQPETEEDSAEAKEQEEIADVSEEPEEVDSETEEADEGAIEDTLLRAMAPVLRAPENNLTNAFYVYFAIPNSWASYDYNKVYVNVRKGDSGAGKDMWAQKQMTDTGRTYNGQEVYVGILTEVSGDTSSDVPWGGVATLQFQAYKDSTWRVQDKVFDLRFTSADTFRNKLRVNGSWVTNFDYDPIHQDNAGKTMAFDNKSGEDLSNVKAIFFEADDNGALQTVDTIELGAVANGASVTFAIPAASCSYVRFEDGGKALGDEYSYFYGDDGRAADIPGTETFTFVENTVYGYRYRGNAADSDWGLANSVDVYFDATLSGLQLVWEGDLKNNQYNGYDGYNNNVGDYSLPNANNGNVYFCSRTKQDDGSYIYIYGTMEAEGDDVYTAEAPVGGEIIFSSFEINPDIWLPNSPQFGKFTNWEEIPDLTAPCFYADSSDDSVYENKYRGGYWDELGETRNAAAGKDTDVVDVHSGTFVYDDEVFYINSTFYDYYTDYELNGYNKDNYHNREAFSRFESHRNWVPFRHFDQALSDAYQEAGVSIPLYTGHFQPDYSDWGIRFSAIANTLNLNGYNSGNQSGFMSTNNSSMDVNGKGEYEGYGKNIYSAAAQGLVSDTLSGGNLMVSGGQITLPHFNESFLTGANSKNTVLGEVYHNVQFPFTKVDLKNNGVTYWSFDSNQTTLAMRKDPSTGYFLYDDGEQHDWSKNVNSTGTAEASQARDEVLEYGFYPFNEDSKPGVGSTYNFGFGAKLEFTFHLTEDGTVRDQDGNKVPIEFNFSGDDDVWVFVDGMLALDMGGDHKYVEGNLNFRDMESTVSLVKPSQGSSFTNLTTGSGPSGVRARVPSVSDDGQVVDTFAIKGARTDKHTLTVFYMERGMWESNMKMSFNFPDENELTVQKTVDAEDVNEDLFKDLFADDLHFTFNVKNLATHFGTTPVTNGETSFQPGFRINQDEIPDYGTAQSGALANAEGAVYTSSLAENGNDSAAVGSDGNFAVKNGETVSFFNQFRRGSYIGLEEVLSDQEKNLYTTTWTVSEPGADGELTPVEAFGSGNTVTNGSKTGLKDQNGTAIDDDRTENISVGRGSTGNNAYQSTGTATHPANTFVFRSYSDPDNAAILTRLNVNFTNKVNTGSLTIGKDKAYPDDALNETYQFIVAFSNVGGIDLEGEDTVYTEIIPLKVGEEYTIDGIPVGTEYTIYELKTMTDGSGLNSVEVDGESAAFTTGSVNGTDAYAMSGTIPNEKGTEITCTFKNTVSPEEPEIPDEPIPDEPTPDEPIPDEPTPDEPTPDEPIPDEPAPNEPATVTEHHRKDSGTAKTGDDSNLVLWTALGLASLAACGGALVLTRKKAKTGTDKRQR